MLPGFPVKSERDSIIEEARLSADLGPEERMAAFQSILKMVSATWVGLSPEERLRRLRIGEKLEPRPQPWWKNVRRD